jgi:hypothetical protein
MRTSDSPFAKSVNTTQKRRSVRIPIRSAPHLRELTQQSKQHKRHHLR